MDSKAIEFLSRSIANTSGDARKHLEILSRTISNVRESLSNEELNTEHQCPVIKLPHVKKTFSQSTMKTKDLLEALPTQEKHVLSFCIELARRGSKPLTLKGLLWVLRECYKVIDVEGTSHLRSLLERLVDTGLLRVRDKKMPADEVRLDEQLEEVESAVRDVLMTQQFYKDMASTLQKISDSAFF